MGIFDKLFGPSKVEKLKEERDVEGLIGKINFGYGGCSDVCQALRQVGDERAVAPLIEVLERSKDKDTQKAAATALGQIGDERAVMPLDKLLEDNGTDGELCLSIVGALGQIGGERAIRALTKAMSDEIRGKKDLIGLMEVSVSMATTHAIKRIGEPAVEPLIRILEEESRNANPIAIRDMTIRERLAARSSAADKMATGAADALGIIRDNRAIEPLVKALAYNGYLEICDRAAAALGNIGESAVESLTKALEDENEKVRERAKEILKWIQKKK